MDRRTQARPAHPPGLRIPVRAAHRAAPWALALGAVKPATIRAWRRTLIEGGTPEPQAVKAYALLRAIFNTAMKEDGIIRQNPCRISGYDRYHTPERSTATIAQVFALADAMPAHFSALVVVALSGLRWGELAALRRRDVDLDAALVRVPRKLAVLNGRVEFGPPKSAAGVRVVALPAAAVEALKLHLGADAPDGPLDHARRAHLPTRDQ